MRRLFGALVIVAVACSFFAPAARASEQWCEDDPPVHIITPAGNSVLIYLTNYGLGLENLPALLQAQVSYTVVPTGTNGAGSAVISGTGSAGSGVVSGGGSAGSGTVSGGGSAGSGTVSGGSVGATTVTAVRLDVLIPSGAAGGFDTRSVVSTAPNATGVVLASASGHSGTHVALTFTLPVP